MKRGMLQVTNENQKNIREFKNLYYNLDMLEEMNKFLDIYDLPKSIQTYSLG
jgi:hypothetical protein